MVSKVAYMSFSVPDLGRSVEFAQSVLGLTLTESEGDTAWLSANHRHHELVLIEGPTPGYETIGLEVPDASLLDLAPAQVEAAGGIVVGDTSPADREVERAFGVLGPGGHVFRLFAGMSTASGRPSPEAGISPSQFEHATLNVSNLPKMERFLQRAFGFRFSDRLIPFGSFWHCNHDHHGIACFWTGRNGLNHYAWTITEKQLPLVAPVLAGRGQKLVWGPGHHTAGDNRFVYFLDPAGGLVEYNWGLGVMPPRGDYRARTRLVGPRTMDKYGSFPPKAQRSSNLRPLTPG